MNTSKRLYRSNQERMFAGVCGGISEYLEVDPTLVRLAFVALTLLGGPGLVIYIVLMLIVPEQPEEAWKTSGENLGWDSAKSETSSEPEAGIVKSSMPVGPPEELTSPPPDEPAV
jgi:phage shock protein C